MICQRWEPLTESQRQRLWQDLTVEKYKKGDIIYKEMDIPRKLMCLVDGKVKVFKTGYDRRNQIIRVIKPTEMFGFRAYLAEEDYNTAAMALENCNIAFIPMRTIKEILGESLSMCHYFIRQLSLELGKSDSRTINLTQKHIRGRLAEALLFLKDRYGVEEDGSTLSIYLSREDLANLSNMTTSNAIRTLSAFANEKIIAIDGRKIKIISDQLLHGISTKG